MMIVRTSPRQKHSKPFYADLSFQVVVGMLIGISLGYWYPHVGVTMEPLGNAFISVIQMLIGPIIFCTVTTGIAGVNDMKKVGRVAIKALVYFEIVTSLALVIGLVAVDILKPGVGINLNAGGLQNAAVASYANQAHHAISTVQFLQNIIPTTTVGAFAKGDILQVLFVSVLFGFGLAAVGERGKPLLDVTNSVTFVLFWIINLVMKVAPIAAFGAIAFTVGKFGLASLFSLGKLIVEFYFTIFLFFVLILLPISKFGGFSLLKLMSYIRAELLLVLGTSSSETVFPQLIEKLEKLGCEKSVVGLVLPTAYSFNHDGSCLYWAAATMFLAQATNTHISWQGQVGLLFVLLLTSKGSAGVSGSAIAVLAATLAATNTIPVNSIALILGIHRVLSAGFVFTNIAGNSVATLIVAKWENALDFGALKTQLDTGYFEDLEKKPTLNFVSRDAS